jgi:hypothetical protein
MGTQSTTSRWTAARDELRARRARKANRQRSARKTMERELATNVTSREVNELRAVLGRYDAPEVEHMHTLIYRRNVA